METEKRTGFSVGPDGHFIPEDRIGRGPNLLGLPRVQRGEEGLELVREEPGRRSPRGDLPEAEMVEDPVDGSRLLDDGDDGHGSAATSTGQGIDLVDLLEQLRPALPAPRGVSVNLCDSPRARWDTL